MGDEAIAYFQRAPTGMVQGWECFEHNGEETCVSEDNVFCVLLCVCDFFFGGRRGNGETKLVKREKRSDIFYVAFFVSMCSKLDCTTYQDMKITPEILFWGIFLLMNLFFFCYFISVHRPWSFTLFYFYFIFSTPQCTQVPARFTRFWGVDFSRSL